MKDFKQQFTIHPVGQGLFYSGYLEFEYARFDMVFDCGSLNVTDVEREKDRYRAETQIASRELDLLVISHFDADHVNCIKKLLDGGIKVRRLVMPFISFVDRLFLVLKRVNSTGGYDPGDDVAIRFAIDPLNELGDNLDGGSEVYVVTNDPKPIAPDGDNGEFTEQNGNSENSGFVFDYEGKQGMQADDLAGLQFGPVSANLYKVKDNKKGFVTTTNLRLMDFLFYKKELGSAEKAFYDKVFELFCAHFSLDPGAPDFKNKVLQSVKTLNNATLVKEFFSIAARTAGLGLEVANLNTTALCMLHRNLPPMVRLVYGNLYGQDDDRPYRHFYGNTSLLYHFKGHTGIFKNQICHYYHWTHYYWSPYKEHKFLFPNTMLTSDTSLYTEADVQLFRNKYQHFLYEFWLMQIPHHGSRHSSSHFLFEGFAGRNHPFGYFINYGLNNSFSHPAEQVIAEINNIPLYLAHEKQGLEFGLTRLPA